MKHTVSMILNQKMEDEQQNTGLARQAAEMTTGEVGVGLKRRRVQQVTRQLRRPLELRKRFQTCHYLLGCQSPCMACTPSCPFLIPWKRNC